MRYMILKLHGNEIRSSCDEKLFFSPCASRLVDAASPRTTSISWSVVKEDCNFSNFGTEAFLVSCYLGHRFCTRCLSTPRWWQKSNDPGTFSALIIEKFQIVHRTLNRRLFQGACLNVGFMTAKEKQNTRKDNLSVILSSLPVSHRFIQSGNSLTFISWYPDPCRSKIIKMDVE